MQKDKQSIQVTIRVRPLSQKQKQQDNRLCVHVEPHSRSIETFHNGDTKKFTYDSVCDNNTQQDMFEQVGKRSTRYCLEGYNCTIFAYGQTGSGKTFTMMGVDPAHEQYDQLRGLIPRTLEYLFEAIDLEIREMSSEYIIRCSFLEIYNEQIIDLLDTRNNTNLQIREDIRKGVYVEGVTEETIFKGEEALEMLKKGSKGRHVGSTCYNQTSSRSHSVFTMQIESKHMMDGVVNTKIRYFHFIDLAGSQRTKQINGQRLKQGCSINKSLHVLGKVINSLAQTSQGKSRHINYRDSKLTFLLKDSLGGNSKTHLIANVSPCVMSYSETYMTLNFARRVKMIKVNKALINEDMSGNLQGLKNQIKRLKQTIIMLQNRSPQHPILSNLPSSQSLPQPTSNPRILSLMNQYVSQQLEKQTRFQQQVNKLSKKVECLMNGVRKFMENETHLRMIIAVYESKVKRLKRGEVLFSVKRDGVNDRSEQSNNNEGTEQGDNKNKGIEQYFRQQRQQLGKQLSLYKQLLQQNSPTLLSLLKSCKVYQTQTSSQQISLQQFIQLLNQNTRFLQQLRSQLSQLNPIPTQLTTNDQQQFKQLVEQKQKQLTIQFNQRQNELQQKIQQLGLEVGQMKIMVQDNEQLLRQAVDREIGLEQVVKQKEQVISQMKQRVQLLQSKLKQMILKQQQSIQLTNKQQQQITLLTQHNNNQNQLINTLQFKIHQHQLTLSNSRLLLQQQQQTITRQNQTLSKQLKQLQKERIDSIQTYQEKLFELERQLKEVKEESQVKCRQLELERQVTQKKLGQMQQQMRQGISQLQQQLQSQRQLYQQSMTTIATLNSKLSNTSKQLASLTDTNTTLSQRNRTLQQKLTTTSTLSNQQHDTIQHLTTQSIKHQHQLQSTKHKLTSLESLFQQRSQQLQNIQTKASSREQELMKVISQLEDTSDKGSEEFNRLRVEMIKVREKAEEMEVTNQKLNRIIRDLNQRNQDNVGKMQHMAKEILEKQALLLNQKQQSTKRKEQIRQLTYTIEQLKSTITKLQHTATYTQQQLSQLTTKHTTLQQQLTTQRQTLTQHKLASKQQQTKLYCQLKSLQLQKQSLLKQSQLKYTKLNQTINQKSLQIRRLQKAIGEITLQREQMQREVQEVRLEMERSEQVWRVNLQEELRRKDEEMEKVMKGRQQRQDRLRSQLTVNQERTLQLQTAVSKLTQKMQQETSLITELHSQISRLTLQTQTLNSLNTSLNQQLSTLTTKHQLQLQQLQIQHNNQIDSKNQKIQMLEEEIGRKEEEVRRKDEQIKRIEQQIARIEEQVERGKGRIEEVGRELGERDRLLGEREEQLLRTSKMLQQSNASLASLKCLNSQLSDTINTLQQQSATTLTQQCHQLQQRTLQLRTLSQTLATTQQQLQHLTTTSLQQSTLISTLTQQLSQSKSLISELTNTNESYLKQIQTNAREVENISGMLEEKEGLISELNKQLYEMQKCYGESKMQGERGSRELDVAKVILDEKEREIQQIVKELRKVTLQREQLMRSKQLLQNDYRQLQNNYQQLQCNHKQLSTHNQHLQQQIQCLNIKFIQINSTYLQLQTTHTQLQTTHTQLQTTHTQLQTTYSNLQQQTDHLSQHHKQLQLTHQQLQHQYNQLFTSHSQLTTQYQSLSSQLLQLKSTTNIQSNQYRNRIEQLEMEVKELNSRVESNQLSLKQNQFNIETLNQVTEQKHALQQINKGLGKRTEEVLHQLEQHKTEFRKLQTKYLGEKNINDNLKQLIENSQLQKKQLSTELKQAKQNYQKLVQKISKNQFIHSQKKSQHYLKTVDLLQKSRHQQLQLRKLNQQLKRQLSLKTQSIEKKQTQMTELTSKYEEFIKQMSVKNKQYEQAYMQATQNNEQLMEQQTHYEEIIVENTQLRQQMEENRVKVARMTMKIQQLQERIRSINQEYIQLQNQNHQLKKKILYPGTTDQKISMYVNKLKSQINDLKRQKQILQDTIKKETQEKMRLKTELIKGNGADNQKNDNQSTTTADKTQLEKTRQQLDKKFKENYYLQEMIGEIIDILKIKQIETGSNPKSIKLESVRKAIAQNIKEKIQENRHLKDKLLEMQSRLMLNKENKSISSIVYNGVGSAKKEASTQQKVERQEKREKSFSVRDEDLGQLAKNKMAGQQYSQQKRKETGLKTLVDNEELQRDKMKVKDIISNSGKFFTKNQ